MKHGYYARLLAIGLSLMFVAAGCSSSGNDPDGDAVTAPPIIDEQPDPAEPTATPADGDMVDFYEDMPDPDGIPDDPDETPSPEKMSYEKDYQSFKSANSDVEGWISVPNTVIEYPILRAEDNKYYLHHNAKKEQSKSGAIFFDRRNTDPANDRHLIVYGHNMRNGTMFHELNSFKLKEFFEANPTFTIWIGEEKREFEIFAAYIVTADINFIRTSFKSDEEFVDYMGELKSLSKFTTDVTVGPNDQVATLCTCTYEYDDSRYVVQGRWKRS